MFSTNEKKMLTLGVAIGACGLAAASAGIGTYHYHDRPLQTRALADTVPHAPKAGHFRQAHCSPCFRHIDVISRSSGRSSGKRGSRTSSSTRSTSSTTTTQTKYGQSVTQRTSTRTPSGRTTVSRTVTPTKYGQSVTQRITKSH